MGKSLRSKGKLRMRTIKRATTFGLADRERALRIAEKLHKKPAKEIEEDLQAKAKIEVQNEIKVEGDPIEVDTSKPISTHGWKGSRNDQYKVRKAASSKRQKQSVAFPRRKK